MLGGILGLGVIGFLLLVMILRASLPPLEGTRTLTGLHAPVVVERDPRGRVTLHATGAEDRAFGLGFVHAQDRFFQMDLLRRAGRGELAALLGPSLADVDRSARRHGLRQIVERAYARCSPRERRILAAYARGVEAGRASLRVRPWEYLLLRQAPRPWRPSDSLAVVVAMFRDLQDENAGRERALAAAEVALPAPWLEFLRPPRQPWEAPIDEEAPPAGRVPPSTPLPPVPAEGDAPGPAEEIPARGSNAWAVAAGASRSGRAILANDMHLGLSLPPVWYAVRSVGPADSAGANWVGVTLPGAPSLVVGSNASIAWGFTNSYGDWIDRIALEAVDDDPHRYRSPEGEFELGLRVESIEIAGQARPETLRVRTSPYGPVVEEDLQGRPVALRWVLHFEGALDLGLHALARCRSVEEALDQAPRCGIPQQNIVVADSAGRIAWTIAGRVPRWPRGLDRNRELSSATTSTRPPAFLDPTEVPRRVLGGDGRLWTANARVGSLREQAVLGDGGYALGARARRIREGLMARTDHDERSMRALQLEVGSEVMARWHQVLMGALEEPARTAPAIVASLGAGARPLVEARADAVDYRVVRRFRDRVRRRVMAALTAPARAADPQFRWWRLPRLEQPLLVLVQTRPRSFVPPGAQGWEEFLSAQADSTLADIERAAGEGRARWGDHNRVHIAHPLARVLPAPLRRWLSLPARPAPGDIYVPRVQGPDFGASERLVVAPGHEDEGFLELPGGPSSHPLSAYRRGDFDAWLSGDPLPLLPGPAEHTLRLVPEQGDRDEGGL